MSAALLAACADHYGILVDDLLGWSRERRFVIARHAAMYVLRERDDMPYQSISRLMGRQDHTSAIYGIKTTEKRRKNDPWLDALITTLLALPKHSEAVVKVPDLKEEQIALDWSSPPPKPPKPSLCYEPPKPIRRCKPVNELSPDDSDARLRRKGTDALLAAMQREGIMAA